MATSTLVATAGGATSNSYALLSEADQFHDDRPANASTTWSGASTDAKTEALLYAAKLLDALFEWTGWVTDADQSMLWPRVGMVKRNGYSLDQDTVPQELKDAQAEFAKQLIAEARTDDSDIEAQGITRITAGPVTLQFKDSVFNKVVPDAVALLIPDDWYSRIRGRVSSTRRLMRA